MRPRGFWCRVGGVVALLFVGTPFGVQAAPTVGAPVLSPSVATVGEPTWIVATAVITSDPGDPVVLENGVNLLQVDASGRALVVLGFMRDDGVGADAVAGDGVFTLQFPVHEAVPGEIYVRVSAAFRGLLRRVLSDVATVVVHAGLSTIQSVGPEGGTLYFPNGVVLEVPAGALDIVTTLALTAVPAAEIDALLEAEGWTSHRKRFLGGFQVREHVTFQAPVRARFPVGALRHTEIPLPIGFDLEVGEFRTLPYQGVTYLGDLGLAELEVWHFSGVGVAAGAPVDLETGCLEGESEVDCWARHLACLACETHDPIACAAFMPDSLEPPCCMVDSRTQCATLGPCECCKERTIHVQTSQTEVSVMGCALVGDSVRATFRDCPGAPTVSSRLTGATNECPTDLQPTLTISPASPSLYVCQDQIFQASVIGTSSDGDIAFPVDFVTWETSAVDILELTGPSGGSVTGRAQHEGIARVRAGVPDLRLEATAPVHVINRAVELDAILSEQTLNHPTTIPLRVGDAFRLQLFVEGVCERPHDCLVTVTSSQPEVASVDGGRVTARAMGEAVITAELRTADYPQHVAAWCSQSFAASVTVTVLSPVSVVIQPVWSVGEVPRQGWRRMGTGTSRQLSARIFETETGNWVVTDAVVTWTSSDDNVATVVNGLVSAGMSEGNVTITATVEGFGERALLFFVREAMSLSIETEAGSSYHLQVDAGKDIQLMAVARNARGQPVTLPAGVVWTWEPWSDSHPTMAALTVAPDGRTASARSETANQTIVRVLFDDIGPSMDDSLKLHASVQLQFYDYHLLSWVHRRWYSLAPEPAPHYNGEPASVTYSTMTVGYGTAVVRDGGPGFQSFTALQSEVNHSSFFNGVVTDDLNEGRPTCRGFQDSTEVEVIPELAHDQLQIFARLPDGSLSFATTPEMFGPARFRVRQWYWNADARGTCGPTGSPQVDDTFIRATYLNAFAAACVPWNGLIPEGDGVTYSRSQQCEDDVLYGPLSFWGITYFILINSDCDFRLVMSAARP